MARRWGTFSPQIAHTSSVRSHRARVPEPNSRGESNHAYTTYMTIPKHLPLKSGGEETGCNLSGKAQGSAKQIYSSAVQARASMFPSSALFIKVRRGPAEGGLNGRLPARAGIRRHLRPSVREAAPLATLPRVRLILAWRVAATRTAIRCACHCT